MIKHLFHPALALAALLPAAALAGAAIAPRPGYIDLRVDNDVFSPGRHTDRWYTNGLRLERIYGSEASAGSRLWSGARNIVCDLVCGSGWQAGVMNEGWSFGQNMYTPNRIDLAQPQPNDRPWAGWLYYGRILQQTYFDDNLGAIRQDQLELDLGVVGPWSLAADTQKAWHSLFGWHRPAGWANQLRNEPGVIVGYTMRLSLLPQYDWLAVVPQANVSLGNVLTAASLGATVRLGWHVDKLGAAAQQTSPAIAAERGTDWSAYVFARAKGRAVARNIFLDGNTFRSGPGVHKEPFVADLALGGALGFPFGLRLSYEYVHRTQEFRVPAGIGAAQDFGSIHIGWRLAFD